MHKRALTPLALTPEADHTILLRGGSEALSRRSLGCDGGHV